MDDPTLRWTLMNWLGPEGLLFLFLVYFFASFLLVVFFVKETYNCYLHSEIKAWLLFEIY